jgi:hypothetical protein
MLEVPETPRQQYFKIFGNQKFHIAKKTQSPLVESVKDVYVCLCGNIYPGDVSATPISEYIGDECMSCRHAASKEVYSRRRHGRILEVRIRRAR